MIWLGSANSQTALVVQSRQCIKGRMNERMIALKPQQVGRKQEKLK